jgi:hypothetical protein
MATQEPQNHTNDEPKKDRKVEHKVQTFGFGIHRHGLFGGRVVTHGLYSNI